MAYYDKQSFYLHYFQARVGRNSAAENLRATLVYDKVIIEDTVGYNYPSLRVEDAFNGILDNFIELDPLKLPKKRSATWTDSVQVDTGSYIFYELINNEGGADSNKRLILPNDVEFYIMEGGDNFVCYFQQGTTMKPLHLNKVGKTPRLVYFVCYGDSQKITEVRLIFSTMIDGRVVDFISQSITDSFILDAFNGQVLNPETGLPELDRVDPEKKGDADEVIPSVSPQKIRAYVNTQFGQFKITDLGSNLPPERDEYLNYDTMGEYCVPWVTNIDEEDPSLWTYQRASEVVVTEPPIPRQTMFLPMQAGLKLANPGLGSEIFHLNNGQYTDYSDPLAPGITRRITTTPTEYPYVVEIFGDGKVKFQYYKEYAGAQEYLRILWKNFEGQWVVKESVRVNPKEAIKNGQVVPADRAEDVLNGAFYLGYDNESSRYYILQSIGGIRYTMAFGNKWYGKQGIAPIFFFDEEVSQMIDQAVVIEDPLPDPSTEPQDPTNDFTGDTKYGDTTGSQGSGTNDSTPRDKDNDVGDRPGPNLSALTSGFLIAFAPTDQQMEELTNNLLSSWDIWENIKKWWSDPLEGLVSLHLVPCEVPSQLEDTKVRLGGYRTGINMKKVTEQFVEVDCGNLKIGEHDTPHNWSNYSMTKTSIYLPFIGTKVLPTYEVMGVELNLKYRIDVITGDCVATLSVNKNGEWIKHHQWSGNCIYRLPICNRDHSELVGAVIQSGITIAGAAIGGAIGAAGASRAATRAQKQGEAMIQKGEDYLNQYDEQDDEVKGYEIIKSLKTSGHQMIQTGENLKSSVSSPAKSFSGTYAAVSAASGIGSASKPSYDLSNPVPGEQGWLGFTNPHIILERPTLKIPSGYVHTYGLPSNYYKRVGDLKGFQSFQNLDLTGINATSAELLEIKTTLQSGFYVGTDTSGG